MSTGRDIDADREATRAVMAGLQPIADGRTNWLGHKLGSGAAQIDEMLLTGATMAEMNRARGAAENHLRHLSESHGLQIIESGGVFRFSGSTFPTKATKGSPVRPATTDARTPSRTDSIPEAESKEPQPLVEVKGTVTTQAGDPTGRMQRAKLMLEIAAVAVTVVSGIVALVLRFSS